MSKFYIVEQNALDIGGHYFHYTKEVAKAARKAGQEVVVLSNVRFNGDFGIPDLKVVPSFHYTWLQAQWQPPKTWRPGLFSFDLCNALYETDAEDRDIVFIPTIGDEELVTLLNYLLDQPPSVEGITYHILLRYDPDAIEKKLSYLRPLFEGVKDSYWLKRRVFFHCDTAELCDRFSKVTQLRFSVAPIPFNQDSLKLQLSENEKKPTCEESKPITIAYVGDARREKNYHYLPAAISEVLSDAEVRDKVRFVIQSNFNNDFGEAGIAEARAALEAMSDQKVSLLYNKLDADQYYAHIANADIILAPYSQQNYKRRSSGILVEALAAAKPVIVTDETWMAGQISPSHGIAIETIEQLASGMKKAVLEFQSLKRGAKEVQTYWMEKSSADFFYKHLEDTVSNKGQHPETIDTAPRVLILAEGGAYKYANGSRRILESQLNYLTTAGYAVSVLFLVAKTCTHEEKLTMVRGLNRVVAPYPLCQMMVAFQSSASSNVSHTDLGEAWQGVKHSIKFDLHQSNRFDFSSDTLAYLRRCPPDQILMNYITRFPVLESLSLSDIPVICEIHDIQSQQRAIYGNRQFGDRDWALEKSYLQQCAALISLSPEETSFLEQETITIPTYTTGFFPEEQRTACLELLGLRSLAEVVASCQPRDYDLSWSSIEDRNFANERLARSSKLDLLYVSSDHKPNGDGLRQFIEDCYIPHLKEKKTTFIVAGGINFDFFTRGLPDLPDVHYIGPVANLSPLYAATRLVVLPIWQGAGRAIKTFEALSYGVPIVATPTALRGTYPFPDGIHVGDTGNELAKHILRLLGDPAAREESSKLVASSFKALCSHEIYFDTMNDIFPAQTHGIEETPSASAVRNHIEADGGLFTLNRLIIAWINGNHIDKTDTANLLTSAYSQQMISFYKSLLSGELSPWDIPSFRANPKMAMTLINCQSRRGFAERFEEFLSLHEFT